MLRVNGLRKDRGKEKTGRGKSMAEAPGERDGTFTGLGGVPSAVGVH